MTRTHLSLAVAALLVGTGCTEGPHALDAADDAAAAPIGPNTASLMAGGVAASGEFDAIVDFATLSLSPRGQNCLLQVSGQLVFSGTIEGVATGTTTALVHAPCPEVAAAPGTHRDVFRSELDFEGTIAGVPATADMMYQGRAQEGGRIEARILSSGGVSGALQVDAQVAVGGSYSGSVIVH